MATAAVVAASKQHHTTAVTSSPQQSSTKSQFSFAGVTTWIQGATNKTSMAIFHQTDDGCFVSAEHKTGVLNEAAELQKLQDVSVNGGYTSTPGAVIVASIQTSAGPKQYQLHQYSVTGTGSGGKVKGGNEFGYVPVTSGYLEIKGYCDVADSLPATIPALQAVKFDAANK